MRRSELGTGVCYLRERFSAKLSDSQELQTFVSTRQNKYSYLPTTEHFEIRGKLQDDDYRKICACFSDRDKRNENIARLKAAKTQSESYLSDDELAIIQTNARRIRGEIFFARAWLLCEGQAEHHIVHALMEIAGFPLDAHGVTVIDYQNNGSPGLFASLARAFEFPWCMVCDGDTGGTNQIAQVKGQGFSQESIDNLIVQLANADLEEALVMSVFKPLVILAARQSLAATGAETDAELAALLRRDKVFSAIQIAKEIKKSPIPVEEWPESFRSLLEKIKGIAN